MIFGTFWKKNSLFQKFNSEYVSFLLPAAALVLIFVFPFFWTRCAGFALLLTGTGWAAARRTGHRQGILFSVFIFSYVISPYWTLPVPGIDIPRWMTAIILIILAFVWAWYHTSSHLSKNDNAISVMGTSVDDTGAEVKTSHASHNPDFAIKSPGLMEILGWLSLFFFWGIVKRNSIFADIPWRGDEDYHIAASVNVLRTSINIITKMVTDNTLFYFPAAGMVFFILALSLRRLFKKYYLCAGDLYNTDKCIKNTNYNSKQNEGAREFFDFLIFRGWIAAVAVVWCLKGYNFFPNWQYRLVRYPFSAIWPSILAGWDVAARAVVEPWWFRIAPFTCFFLVAGIVFSWWFRKTDEWLCSFLAGCTVLTMPLVLNYGSMYVLEPFIFPLAVIVFLYPDFLSSTNVTGLRQSPANTALCVLLFLKETALPVIGVVGLMRGAGLLSYFQKMSISSTITGKPAQYILMIKRLFSETMYILMLALAGFPYIWFRLSSGTRPYNPNFSNLLKLDNWTGYANGLWEQTGMVIIMAVSGAAVLIVKKHYINFFPHFLLILIYAIFFTIDGYPGYGRFNFLLLPGVIALFLNAMFYVKTSTLFRQSVPLILICVIAINISFSPLNWKSGLTAPLWERRSDFENDTTYYPVSSTVAWLKKNYPLTNIVFYVHDYRFIALEWAASVAELKYMAVQGKQRGIREAYLNEGSVLAEVLAEAKQRKVSVLVYLCLNGPDIPEIPEASMSNYKLEKLIADPFRAIAIFTNKV